MEELELLQHFYNERNKSLTEGRFPSYLRAVVVETNDPLNMGRVRFRCPEFHDNDLDANKCPWAVPAPQVGGPNAGDWGNVCIGDIVFICFEKDHPYAPIYIAAADPTRRHMYQLESVHVKTPIYLNNDGAVSNSSTTNPNPPNDYNEDYLPKDGRPMSRGIKDRYGSTLYFGSVGYFPSTHDKLSSKPKVNDPDFKCVTMVTKYGNKLVLSDIGYEWQKPSTVTTGADANIGEFTGDPDKDAKFEADRYKYIQKLVSENSHKDNDERRIELSTRAGHKIELRDVGWNNTRANEFTDTSRVISNTDKDERWMKFATKGGHLIEMMDVGFDPINDNYYKRKLTDEVGPYHDEKEFSNDGRQIRIITRHGFKIVLDDRGSSSTDAESKETPHGNGLLIKGRRAKSGSDTQTTVGGSAVSKGYGIEFNEKDQINAMKLYSPDDQLMEINDKDGYVLLCTSLPHEISKPWLGTKGNEFATKSGRFKNNDTKTFHLLLDKKNEYARLKSPKLQGLEIRDDKEWVELRDNYDRGIFTSENKKFIVMRSVTDVNAFLMVNDENKSILIYNDDGKIRIQSKGDIEIVSDGDINLKANNINFRAKTAINMSAMGISGKLGGGKLGVNGDIHATNVRAFIPDAERPLHINGKGVAKASPISGTTPNLTKIVINRNDISPKEDPNERGFAPNTPTSEVDQDIIDG